MRRTREGETKEPVGTALLSVKNRPLLTIHKMPMVPEAGFLLSIVVKAPATSLDSVLEAA